MQQIGLLFEELAISTPPQAKHAPIVLIYEYPLTERIRALLRLEDLFARMAHYLGAPDIHDHHAALTVLFEILEVARTSEPVPFAGDDAAVHYVTRILRARVCKAHRALH